MRKKAVIAIVASLALLTACSNEDESHYDKYYIKLANRIQNNIMVGRELSIVDAPSDFGWDKVSSGTELADESNYWHVKDVPEGMTIVFCYQDDQNIGTAVPDGEIFVDRESGVSCIIEDGIAKFRTPDMNFNCSSIWAIENNNIWLVWYAS